MRLLYVWSATSLAIASASPVFPKVSKYPEPTPTENAKKNKRVAANVLKAVSHPFAEPSMTVSVMLSATSAPTSESVLTNAPTIQDPIHKTTYAPEPTTCTPLYKNKYTEVKGTGDLPKPTGFITTYGNAFVTDDDDSLYRPVGPNIYWLCADENVKGVPKGTYTSKRRIREALAIAVAMGANTVRLTSCGVSVGLNTSIEPTLDHYQDPDAPQWDAHDYAIYAAGEYGLRVILPLTDQFNYYHGGLGVYAEMENSSVSNYSAMFNTSGNVTSDFIDYIHHLVPHVNRYNKKRYADDPIIMAWETGNELGGAFLKYGFPSANWTDKVVQAIRWHDTQHIIIDGGFGIVDNYRNQLSPGLNNTWVDSLSDHFYPRNTTRLAIDAVASFQYQKPWLIGEYDWTASSGQGDPLDSFLQFIESDTTLGDIMWGVQGHDDRCCHFITHNDGYSAYYPNGNSEEDQENLLKVVQHWYGMTKREPPSDFPAVACPQPFF